MDESIEVLTKVNITPRLLAECFWNMDSKQQAQFFAELHDVTKDKFHGDMQWAYMSDDINKIPAAKNMACRMTCFIFNHASDYLDRMPLY